jgi:hypothetical protein
MAEQSMIVASATRAAETIAGLASIASRERRDSAGSHRPSVVTVCAALQEFGECVRYLNTRRSSGTVLHLESEAAVQDALYLMLRPWIHDLVAENPTDRSGNRYSVADFRSRGLRLFIEAKFVRDKQHGRNISKELHDDIEMYRQHPDCGTILFFIYDPDSNIPDQRELKRVIEEQRTYGGRPLTCMLVVKP